MTPQSRIRLARRHAGMSQLQLASIIGVQRSAVSHWESTQAKNPSVEHLRQLAVLTGVQFEWLVTGRGGMALSHEVRMDSVPAAEALLIDEPIELRLLHAFREVSAQSRVSLVDIIEQLASQRTGRSRDSMARSAVVHAEAGSARHSSKTLGTTLG